MVNLVILTSIALLLAFGCEAQEETRPRTTPKSSLEKYIFCNCLYQTLPNKEELQEKEGSGGHYVQIGSYAPEVYASALVFLKNHLEQTQDRYINFYEKPNIGIVQCLDLLESDELARFISEKANERE